MTVTERPRRGRPTREEGAALEERLRTAAVDAFTTHGFEGTTMEAVAAAAGISKRTLYAKYPDKRALFTAVVPWALAQLPLRDEVLDLPDDDLAASLRTIGEAVLASVTHPQAVKLRRLAMLEAHRFPEFADAGNLDAWRQSVQLVVDLLAVHAETGAVVVDDLELTADLFIEMVAGSPTMLADFGVFRSPADEARHLDLVVRVFLRGVLPRR
jgi:AcrR family transcriptional regulator